MTKWYSGKVTAEEAEKLEKKYAKITNPTYGLTDRDLVALQFSLQYEYKCGAGTKWHLANEMDIKELFVRTNTDEVSKLEGKVIEAFIQGQMLICISVNENLV